jgi:hypothetical protein
MSYEQNSAAANKVASETLVDDPFGRVNIQSGKNIIEQQCSCTRVDRTCEGNPGLEIDMRFSSSWTL